ncbi:MAG: hypothetical protein IKT03_05615 [Muribaculaceae bacterium]|nr:hypothetical protein [Muribaculaceae bacterium]MBR6489996.1 hypothetical protein [Muribaculaceae bacterium]
MAANNITEQDAVRQRQLFVEAFNATQIMMWQEQITLLDVIDTGALLNSVAGIRCDHDGKVTVVTLEQSFLQYGLWQEYGVGRETPTKGSGRSYDDFQHDNARQRRPWMSKKLFASVMKLKEMFADSMGREFCGIVADALSKDKMLGR